MSTIVVYVLGTYALAIGAIALEILLLRLRKRAIIGHLALSGRSSTATAGKE